MNNPLHSHLYRVVQNKMAIGHVFQPSQNKFAKERQYNTAQNFPSKPDVGWYVAGEMIFERIRSMNYSTLPSRMDDMVYAFDNVLTAIDQRNIPSTLWGSNGVIHVCEALQLNAPYHKADMSLADATRRFVPNISFYDHCSDLAHSYWQGHLIGGPVEILTESPLKVIGWIYPQTNGINVNWQNYVFVTA
jgi:hypothetical protein